MEEHFLTLVIIGHLLGTFTFSLGTLIEALPLPWKEIKAHGKEMIRSACISEFALGTVSLVQIIVTTISELIGTSLGGPYDSSTTTFDIIISQLVNIVKSIFLLTATAGGTSRPEAELLTRVLESTASWCSSAIILWWFLRIIVQLLPKIWLTMYLLGVCFFALSPIGKRLGACLMATSLVLAVCLPPMPTIAISLQEPTQFEVFIQEFENLVKQMQEDPSKITDLTSSIPEATGRLMASVFISLIGFAFAYLFALSILTRSLTVLLGGGRSGSIITRLIMTPTR